MSLVQQQCTEEGGQTQDYDYDALGRSTVVTNPNATTVRSFYNHLSTAVIDENDHQTITTKDGFGRHIRTDQYDGEYTTPDWTSESYFHADYDYDVLDNLLVVTNRAGQQIVMQYDALSRKTYLSDPNMGTWYYDYDAVGNLIKQVDAGEQRICFYYDELDRLKGKSYFTGFADCPADQGYDEYLTTYYYDGAYPSDDGAPQPQGQVIGKRTAMGWGVNDWTVYHYADIRGRLNQEQTRIDGQTYSTGYSYDAMDRMTGMTYPNAGTEPVAYTYNDQGLLDSVVGNQPYVAGSIYDEAGRLISRVQQNNANEWVTTYTYHLWNDNPNLGRLSTITASGTSDTGSAEYQNLRYSYDRVGNVEMIEDLKVNQTQSFDYDYLDRLTSASASVGDGNGVYEEAYQYYRGGSLQRKGDPVNTSDGLYDYLDDNHSHAVTGYRGNTYAYDANGNMTSRTVDGVSYSLDYDMENPYGVNSTSKPVDLALRPSEAVLINPLVAFGSGSMDVQWQNHLHCGTEELALQSTRNYQEARASNSGCPSYSSIRFPLPYLRGLYRQMS